MKINVDYKSLNDDISKILSNLNGQYFVFDTPLKETLKFVIKNNDQYNIFSSCKIKNYEIELNIYLEGDKIIIILKYKIQNYPTHFEFFGIYPYKSEISKNSVLDKNQIDNHIVNQNQNSNNSIQSENSKKIIDKLINSKFGIKNFSGSCAIASIIQILAHSKIFLFSFYENPQHSHSKDISNALMDLFQSMSSSKEYYLQDEFEKFFLKIKKYFNLNKIEPTYFLNLLIQQLDKENKGIISPIFAGKSIINCYYNNYIQKQLNDRFLIYMLNVCNYQTIKDYIDKGQKSYNEKCEKTFQIEKICETSNIFIINVKCNNQYVNFPNTINIREKSYTLYGINIYNDNHSIA